MKNAGIEVNIGRLVIDAPQRGQAAGLADAIGAALRERLAQSPAGIASAQETPHVIADRIATQVTAAVPRSGIPRGKP